MSALINYIKEIVNGAWTLILGFTVTVPPIFKRSLTLQYPREKEEMDPAYRGHIELAILPGEDGHFCVACGTCERACPSDLIKIQGIKPNAAAGKTGILFLIDFSRCSLCGLCVDVCPVDALRHSMEYELAHYSRYDSVIDLHARFIEQSKKEG